MQFESSEIATFLFTTIDDRSAPIDRTGKDAKLALANHDRLVAEAIEAEDGKILKSGSGAFRAVFSDPANAVRAAVKIQMALTVLMKSGAGKSVGPGVRIALHSGMAEHFDLHYSGPVIARADALVHSAHGGQILVSESTRNLVYSDLPHQVSLQDLGPFVPSDARTPIRIWQLCHPDLPCQFPNLALRSTTATNLPIHSKSFLGRRSDIAQISVLVSPLRPTTLIGEPGIGKTRLAHEVGLALLDAYPDGVWQIELESVPETACLAIEIAVQFGLRQKSRLTAIESLVTQLRDKRLLLILDHFDHLVPTCADLIERLNRDCRHAAILATGSVPIGAEDERTYRVPPMSLPPAPVGNDNSAPLYSFARFESVRLYLARARSRRDGFEMEPDLGPTLCRLCLHLNGNPLAIEIAAAHAHALTLEEFSETIAAASAETLTDTPPTLPGTDSLSATIDWVYSQLSIKEKLLLLRLSVFADDWNLEDAEAICSDSCEAVSADPEMKIAPGEVGTLVQELIDHALIRSLDAKPAARLSLSRTIRNFAQARHRRMRDHAKIRDRHCGYYFRLALRASETVSSPERDAALSKLAHSSHNLREALRKAAEDAERPAIPIPAAAIERMLLFGAAYVSLFAQYGSGANVRKSLAAALDAAGYNAVSASRAAAHLAIARIDGIDGRQQQASASANKALGMFRRLSDTEGTARCLEFLAEMERASIYDSNNTEVRPFEAVAESWMQPPNAGISDIVEPQLPGRREEILKSNRQSSHERAAAEAMDALSGAALDREDTAAARGYLEESLRLWRKLRNTSHMASALGKMARVVFLENKPQLAASLFTTSCRLYEQDDVLLSERERTEQCETKDWILAHIDSALIDRAAREESTEDINGVLDRVIGPVLRLVEGGMPASSGVPTAREANQKP